MIRRYEPFGTAARLLAVMLVASVAAADAGLDGAVQSAINAVESRVVQLRYFGAAEGALGATTPRVSGYELGSGWVLTSLYGLKEEPAAIVCRTPAGDDVAARLTGRDLSRGLALLRLEGTPAEQPPSESAIRGRDARVGETAIAVGRAYEPGGVNLAVGVVSAIGRLGGRAIQTDAATSPVNYGGPLIGLDGRLLGLIAPLTLPGQSAVGLYDSGVGFAVPASQITPRLERLAAGETILPGWIGVTQEKSDPLRRVAQIAAVRPGGPAATAGLLAGDTVTRVGGLATPTAWSFRRVLSGLDAGETIDLLVTRGGKQVGPIGLTLAEKPPASEPAEDGVTDAVKPHGQ